MREAAPWIVLGVDDETASYWIAVDGVGFFGVLVLVRDVEVVVAALPKLLLGWVL